MPQRDFPDRSPKPEVTQPRLPRRLRVEAHELPHSGRGEGEQKRSVWRIGKVLWFNFRDPGGGNSNICGYCTSAGLLTNAFQRKPAWSAFLNYTGG